MLNFEIPIFGHLFLSIFENSKKLSPKKNEYLYYTRRDLFPLKILGNYYIIVGKKDRQPIMATYF